MCFRVSIVVVAGPGEVTGYSNNTNKHNNQQGGGQVKPSGAASYPILQLFLPSV